MKQRILGIGEKVMLDLDVPKYLSDPDEIASFKKVQRKEWAERAATNQRRIVLFVVAGLVVVLFALLTSQSRDGTAPMPQWTQKDFDVAGAQVKRDMNGELGMRAIEVCSRILGIAVPVKNATDVLRFYDSKKAIDFTDCVVNYMYPVPASNKTD